MYIQGKRQGNHYPSCSFRKIGFYSIVIPKSDPFIASSSSTQCFQYPFLLLLTPSLSKNSFNGTRYLVMSSHDGPGPLGALKRRRNGKQQACEPCRKGSYAILVPQLKPFLGFMRYNVTRIISLLLLERVILTQRLNSEDCV